MFVSLPLVNKDNEITLVKL